MNTPATPSLPILKSDAERLLRDARDGCPDAMIRLVQQGFRSSEELTHSRVNSAFRSLTNGVSEI